jgi:hypothetical protein
MHMDYTYQPKGLIHQVLKLLLQTIVNSFSCKDSVKTNLTNDKEQSGECGSWQTILCASQLAPVRQVVQDIRCKCCQVYPTAKWGSSGQICNVWMLKCNTAMHWTQDTNVYTTAKLQINVLAKACPHPNIMIGLYDVLVKDKLHTKRN